MITEGLTLTSKYFYLLGLLGYLTFTAFLIIKRRKSATISHPDEPEQVAAAPDRLVGFF